MNQNFIRRALAPGHSFIPLPRLRILHATDLHYIAPALTDHGPCFTQFTEQSDGKVMRYSEELAEAFAEQAAAEKPNFVILSGDLTFNGARASHEALAAKLARITAAGVPVFVLPGNHDLENAWAARFSGDELEPVESVSPAQFAALYAPFGYGQALARDSGSLSYAAEPVPGLRLLLLDGNTPSAQGRLTDAALSFAQKQLRAARRAGARVLAVSHQPLLAHNPLFADAFSMGGAARAQALYEKYGVLCNLCGHMHLQHSVRSEAGLLEIAGSALSVAPDQYGLLTLDGGQAEYRTVPLDLSGWAVRAGRGSEAVFSDFAAYAAEFFRRTCLWQAAAVSEAPLSEANPRLAAFYADVSAVYFSGRTDRLVWDEALFQQWRSLDASVALYLQSIRDEARVNHTQLCFPL